VVGDPGPRGRTYGVVGFAQTIGIAVAPLTGNSLVDAAGSHHMVVWGAIASIGVAQAACFAAFVRRREAVWDEKTPAPRAIPRVDSAS
jgi:hypothetical protein